MSFSVMELNDYFGMWLSLVERGIWDAKVAGSNPVIPTIGNSYPFGNSPKGILPDIKIQKGLNYGNK